MFQKINRFNNLKTIKNLGQIIFDEKMSERNSELEEQVNVAAFFLAREGFAYDKLCWMLAKRRLRAERDARYNQEERVKERAAEIYFQYTPYDILCWLVSELDILIKFGKL